MQRNKNHIIVIGIVLILLMLTYNMDMASSGTQESTGIWMWLNASNNAGAVQAIGNILQVIAAVLTFGAMVYLGCNQYKISKQQTRLTEEQKEMTRRQINLSLYEKRYKIYKECQNLIRDFTMENIQFGEFDATNSWRDYQERVRNRCYEFSRETQEKEFLFDDDLVKIINDILDMVQDLHGLSGDVEGREDLNSHDFSRLVNQVEKIKKERENLNSKFKSILDFKEI